MREVKMTAILVRDVREGDTVCERQEIEGFMVVAKIVPDGGPSWPRIRLTSNQGKRIIADPNRVIGLIHRSLTEGVTNSDALQAIASAAFQVHALRGCTIGVDAIQGYTHPELAEALAKLRKALDIWELSEPLETQRAEGSYEDHFDSSGNSRGVGADD